MVETLEEVFEPLKQLEEPLQQRYLFQISGLIDKDQQETNKQDRSTELNRSNIDELPEEYLNERKLIDRENFEQEYSDRNNNTAIETIIEEADGIEDLNKAIQREIRDPSHWRCKNPDEHYVKEFFGDTAEAYTQGLEENTFEAGLTVVATMDSEEYQETFQCVESFTPTTDEGLEALNQIRDKETGYELARSLRKVREEMANHRHYSESRFKGYLEGIMESALDINH